MAKLYRKNYQLKEDEKLIHCSCCDALLVIKKNENEEGVYCRRCGGGLNDNVWEKLRQKNSWDVLPYGWKIFLSSRDDAIQNSIKNPETLEKWKSLPLYKRAIIILKMLEDGKII